MDRLTALMERFQLRVEAAAPEDANLLALAGADGTPGELLFYPAGTGRAGDPLFAARVSWSGESNPFLAALPEVVRFDLSADPEARAVVELIRVEVAARRCGAQSVVNRLGEVLMVRLLRDQIAQGATRPGLLAGLADPRLSRAIVAIHDHPGRVWSNGDLAAEAGLSLSRFAELFAAQVGETPMGYLRRWRLILAAQDLGRGDRVDRVARRYAYGSPEAFARAFRRAHGVAPMSLRAG
ncbi:AraC family transcriptional regulator [Ruegeria pomeroyi]|nr:AraC family transcriptional regulator [Ruegeria pomeroyi]NVK99462.1 helix-turn-helix transcriptional regulator [Ruegeria pomeroyi]NVK99709.1 helix-turn-helix transcriptional regulator [Ruegeria pomeroyi]QWV08041.1 AraC family transcriptional regulator [Ruegeria pomeroyi]